MPGERKRTSERSEEYVLSLANLRHKFAPAKGPRGRPGTLKGSCQSLQRLESKQMPRRRRGEGTAANIRRAPTGALQPVSFELHAALHSPCQSDRHGERAQLDDCHTWIRYSKFNLWRPDGIVGIRSLPDERPPIKGTLRWEAVLQNQNYADDTSSLELSVTYRSGNVAKSQ